jgi:hypothetical protein
MALAETMNLLCEQCATGVKEAVTYIDAPRHESQEHWNPYGQAHSCRFGKNERPRCGNGGRVEAQQVPKAQGARCFEYAAHWLEKRERIEGLQH